MKGSECRLIEYMEGSKKRFIIPVYQRNYDWKTENCKQLYDDLIKVIKHNRRSHFFGSLVSVYNPSGRNTEFLVIDGQQRLTTVSLLLLAMYNLISAGVVITQDDSLGKQIYEEFLVDKYQPEEKRIKLKPVKNDQKAFGKLFAEEKDHIRESNLTANYNYFYDRIQKQEITIDELFDAICSLEIINITLNNDDNPQLIFESLNSTGLDLSEGDKIRNFILMGLPTSLQDSYYENYWNRIEECTKYDVSSYIRDYLSVKQQSIPSQKRIYANFKEYVELVGVQTEDLLKELLAYARRYQILLNGGTHSKKLDACIYRLNRLETTVTRPFFLEVLRLLDEEKLDIAQVADIFLTTENYLFRRTICDLPTNALNKIFLMLHREVVRYDGTENDYVAKVKYALLVKKERARFPDDDEFATAFTERQIYLMNSKNKVYILERLENSGTAEDKDVYGHCDDGVYSIEHIMPQHLTPTWIKELGEDYEQIHEQWLHRIAMPGYCFYCHKQIQVEIMRHNIAGAPEWFQSKIESKSICMYDDEMILDELSGVYGEWAISAYAGMLKTACDAYKDGYFEEKFVLVSQMDCRSISREDFLKQLQDDCDTIGEGQNLGELKSYVLLQVLNLKFGEQIYVFCSDDKNARNGVISIGGARCISVLSSFVRLKKEISFTKEDAMPYIDSYMNTCLGKDQTAFRVQDTSKERRMCRIPCEQVFEEIFDGKIDELITGNLKYI